MSFQISNIKLDNIVEESIIEQPPLKVKHLDRLDYIFALLGKDHVLDNYHHSTLKLAVDGLYNYTERDKNELQLLAKELSNKDAILTKLGRGTLFYHLVKIFKDQLNK